ncbi:hypothetical protein [Streptomyces sp. NBC_00258]|uniref:hypothetical protein n=1 Tax=Streptomyces sp. NBC_00258 TaxID=2903642 RepID=UPI002E2E10E2|nr:hypothetical protein [Streptomyces sp. NBC_00258]
MGDERARDRFAGPALGVPGRGGLARLGREPTGDEQRFQALRLGTGAQEVHPINQSRVDRPRQRGVEFRTMNVRHWDRIVAAWVAGNERSESLAYSADVPAQQGFGVGVTPGS